MSDTHALNGAVVDEDVTATFGNIVCGVGFSPTSLRALSKALIMAQRSGGRITLIHMLEGFRYRTVYSESGAFRLLAEYRAQVEKMKRELRTLVPPDALNWCDVYTEVVSGIPHEAILATATARKADLVAIGLPRRTRFDRIVMASTASGVLRRARSPVLAVPGAPEASKGAARAIDVSRDHYEAVVQSTAAHFTSSNVVSI